ncbi:MAG: hypothetical protein ABSG33_10600 [Candidatus Bathyarchaeia archaeon]
MELRYFVPFKAQDGVNAQYALREKLVNIEGVAIDTSVNANKWQVPQQDLEYVASSLAGAQLRVDHAESALMVVGKVSEAKRDGDRVLFRAEVGEERLIEKILRGYVTHVSIQVDSDDVECSKCKRPTRKEGMLVHLCPGAWEIIHRPKVRELSVVASPAYKETAFQPVGFFAAMNRDQWDAIVKAVADSQLSENDNEDVGSRHRPQEPESKLFAREVRHLSEHNSQMGASPHKAQGVVNVAPDEEEPKQVTYEDFMQQLQDLEKQITNSSTSEADVEALKKKVSELEDAVAKKATKRSLSRKISELSKQLQQPQQDGEDEGDKQETQSNSARHASGKGIVAADEMQRDALGNYDWFKDLLKAHKKLTGFH